MQPAEASSWTLARLLGYNLEPAAFWRDHATHAVVFRGDSLRAGGSPPTELMSLERLRALVASAPPEHIESLRGVSRPYDGSGSLRLLRAQALDASLRDLALGLLDDVGEEINVNVYLSPAGAEGLAPHADLYDVFVLQIAGQKQWELLGMEGAPDVPFGERVADSGTTGCFTLGSGDVLFLPAGLRHRADNLGPGPSLHLTIGIFTKSDRSVVEWLASELTDGPRARWLAGREDFADAVDATRRAAETLLSDQDAVARFVAHRHRVEYERTLASVAEHQRLDARGYR